MDKLVKLIKVFNEEIIGTKNPVICVFQYFERTLVIIKKLTLGLFLKWLTVSL